MHCWKDASEFLFFSYFFPFSFLLFFLSLMLFLFFCHRFWESVSEFTAQ